LTTKFLKVVALCAVSWPVAAVAQGRALGVCEALNSVEDHKEVVIRADLALTRHDTFLAEGTGEDPCPGWRQRLFTAPSVIPLVNGSAYGVSVPESQVHQTLDLFIRLRMLQSANPASRPVVTLKGVLIRRKWLFVFRSSDGTYCCYDGAGIGNVAAALVVTSVVSDH
jgi:hypothetical protein